MGKVFGYPEFDENGEKILTTYDNDYKDMLMDIRIYRMKQGDSKEFIKSEEEMAVLLLKGGLTFKWNQQEKKVFRKDVFTDGLYAVHVCKNTGVKVIADTDAEILVQCTHNEKEFEAHFYDPENTPWIYSCKGKFGGVAQRRVSTAFDYETAPYSNMVLGEVLNDPGNWSGYIPHTHPQPETYYFLFDRPEGFGASFVGDEVFKSVDGSFSAIPGGKVHPQSCAPGFQMYTCWMIRHLPGNPWTDRIDDERYTWLYDYEGKGEGMLDKEKVSLGIAPIGWTNDDMPDLGKENTFEQCISEMALAGFKGCEVGSKYPKDAAVLKKALDLRGIQVCNQWFSSFLLTKSYEEVEKEFINQLEFLKALGAKVIGASEQSYSTQGKLDQPIFEGKYVMNDDEWKRLSDGLNRLGRVAKDHGMTLTYHHHMGTVVQTEEEIDRFMEMVDPKLVFLLFDSGHLSFAGIDPEKVLRKYVNRVRHVHLKDIRRSKVEEARANNWSFLKGVREGVFTVPGDGDVDFAPLFSILEEAGYQGWVVVEAEQDPAKANPFEYARKARAYIAQHTGL